MRETIVCVALICMAGCSSCEDVDVDDEPIVLEPLEDEESSLGDEICDRWQADHERGWCVPAGRGAWWLEREARPTDCGEGSIPESGETGRMRLGFTAEDGTRVPAVWDEFDDCSSNVEYTAVAHYDWDGDGYDELAVRRSEGYLDGGESRTWIERFADGELGGVELPDEGGQVFEVRDEDWDGRLDIVTRGPHFHGPFESDCCANVFSGGPSTLWHSLPDGSFTRSDEVAKTHLREMCGDTQTPLLEGALDAIAECWRHEAWGDVQRSVTCARLGGDDVERIRQRVAAEVAAYRCEGECCDELARAVDDAVGVAEAVDVGVML